jgi:hypothetical protein
MTSASSAGHRSGGDTRDASHISITAAMSKVISLIPDAGSQPATPEATRAMPAVQVINHGFERFGVRRQPHTARPRTAAATKMAEEGKVSMGRQTHHPARLRRVAWAMTARRSSEPPSSLSDHFTVPIDTS